VQDQNFQIAAASPHFLQIEDSAARAKATAKAQLGRRGASEHASLLSQLAP
jgi:hypothetical protein